MNPILHNPVKNEPNFVGLLQQVCQFLGWELPEYSFSEEQANFTCFCRVSNEKQQFVYKATGKKKKLAKHSSATVTLKKIQDHFQANDADE